MWPSSTQGRAQRASNVFARPQPPGAFSVHPHLGGGSLFRGRQHSAQLRSGSTGGAVVLSLWSGDGAVRVVEGARMVDEPGGTAQLARFAGVTVGEQGPF